MNKFWKWMEEKRLKDMKGNYLNYRITPIAHQMLIGYLMEYLDEIYYGWQHLLEGGHWSSIYEINARYNWLESKINSLSEGAKQGGEK